ncbi:MAG TPA: GNAT family protein [Acidimicrobiales bacterium]|nr:GNAT family protein [Acidimicrobiales bacterium]
MSELFSLDGRHVCLEPMQPAHAGELLAAATADRSTFDFTLVPASLDAMAAYIDAAVEARALGQHYPFATRDADSGRIVGATRYYDIAIWDWSTGPAAHLQRHQRPDVVSIGYTWLQPAAQRSPINTEAKLLMLDHAFGSWAARAVRLETDERNARSRQAIGRLGCQFEGVLRAHRPGADGTVRNTASFSMLADEWPVHRRRLADRLARG